MMALAGITGLLAIVGGGMYLLITVWSVFLGKKIRRRASTCARATAWRRRRRLGAGHRRARLGRHGGARDLRPGARVPDAFVLYYFVNWKYLSTVWPLK